MGQDAGPLWTPGEKDAIVAELGREFPDRQLYPVQRGNLASQWELVAHLARRQDASSGDPGKTWVPPTLAALVTAVRRTRLSRFYPFTGHEYLYFADGPGVWDEKGEIAPAWVGNRPEGYLVFQGPPAQAACTLTTHDPDEAAAEAERLLEGWVWSGLTGGTS